MNDGQRPLVGITLGDPAGVGPEIILKALQQADIYETSRPLVIADRMALERAGKAIGQPPKLNPVTSAADGTYTLGTIDLYDVSSPDLGALEWGKVQDFAGRAAFRYVETATRLALAGEIEAMATAVP
jgi:4-phospho-D-threonate 3-dehydrogenase / 4-phospho-D-erythronate 3-dehydrogenase